MKKLFIFLLLVCVRQINAQIITTVAGGGNCSTPFPYYCGDGGQATAAGIIPSAIILDAAGNMYIANDGYSSTSEIRKVDTAGIITTVAGTGSLGYSGDGGPATAAQLNSSNGVALDAFGNLYIADEGNNRIRKVDTAGIISTVAGNGTLGYSGDGGPATAAGIGYPYGIAFDAAGNLYFSDIGNNVGNSRIRKIDTAGIISTIAGNGILGYSGDGGPATAAALNEPAGITIDVIGNLYIADLGNNRIRKIDTAGIISTIAGNGILGYGGDGGLATSAALKYPEGLAVDAQGNLYIADAGNMRIRKVNTFGIITTIAGNGTGGYNGDGGLSTATELNEPLSVAVDTAGNLYIADYQNLRIRKVVMCNTPITVNISGPNNICGGTNTTYTAVGANTYTWSTNVGSTTSNTITVGPTNTETYTVIGITGGCMSFDTITVTVNPILSFSGTPIVCDGGGSTVLIGNGATTYSWSANAGSVTTNTVLVSPPVPTTYTLTGMTGGCTATETIAVSISVPIQYISSNSGSFNNICSAASCPGCIFSLSPAGTATSFTWMPGNVHAPSFVIPNSINGTYTYSVTAIDSLGCIDSDTITVTVVTCVAGINSNININKQPTIYPNPTSDQFFIETNTIDKLTVDLYDFNGRHVFSKSISDKSSIDVTNLNEGIYNLTIKMADRVINKKLVILR